MTRALFVLLMLAVTLAGCAGRKDGDDTAVRVPLDRDGDGYSVGVDCDDDNPDAFPGAAERCDGVDNDCNEEIDERWSVDAPTWYLDADGDGAGDPRVIEVACASPAGFVAAGTDCDDTDPAVVPGAVERCDGLDNDCDGRVDLGAVDAPTWSFDEDGDGVAGAVTLAACTAPVGGAPFVGGAPVDCDDADPRRFPGATEVCNGADDDCDGVVDGPVAADAIEVFPDGDGDGQGAAGPSLRVCTVASGWVADSRDCNDGDPAVRVGATERCDGIDNDCDGLTDGPDAVDPTLFYADGDGDGFTAAGAVPVAACAAPAGTLAAVPGRPLDCDDTDAAVFPGAPERCGTAADEDCDGAVDEDDAVDASTWYSDADGDGFGAPAVSIRACVAPARHVAAGTDCDDARAHVAPGAAEVCDGLDNDCDPTTDEDDVDGRVWFFDADGDGFGAASAFDVQACSAPVGYTDAPTDCDDFDPTVAPDAPEICDGLDNDCDGGADNDAVDAQVFYADRDGDTFGDPLAPALACAAPAGTVANRGDCDDGNPARRPDAVEVCDGLDNDCDAIADDGDPSLDPSAGAVVWYVDDDGDGFGDPDLSGRACAVLPAGTVADNTDCDDAEASVYPGAVEACDDVDNDCNLLVDDTVEGAPGALTLFRDGDGDGFGNDGSRSTACPGDFPADAVSVGTDCDDGDPATYPGAPESCNAADDDCDGLIDVDDPDFPLTAVVDAFSDDDGDGFGDATSPRRVCVLRAGFAVANDEDCDDARATVNPAASEVCDSVDNDCNGFVDTLDPGLVATASAPLYPRFADADGDGFGPTGGTATNRCQATEAGFSAVATDCDDDDDSIYPGAPEACDGVDANCDGNLPPPAGVSFRDTSGTSAVSGLFTLNTPGELLVCPGTHTVSATISAAVTVRAWNPAEPDGDVAPTSPDYLGPDSYVLTGPASGTPLLIFVPSTVSETLALQDITLRASASDAQRLVDIIGSAAFMTSVTLTNVLMDAETGVVRPGIGATYTNLQIEDSTFAGLTAVIDNGGAIDCADCALDARGTAFVGNEAATSVPSSALAGGAVYLLRPTGTSFADGCSFDDNSTDGFGGAVAIQGELTGTYGADFEDVVFERNAAALAGGALWSNSANLTGRNLGFLSNTAVDGGAIASSSATLELTRSRLASNVASGAGGAVYVNDTSLSGRWRTRIDDTTIESNGADYGGGVAFLVSAVGHRYNLDGVSFLDNQADSGGGLYVGDHVLLEMQDVDFLRNVATTGPAVFIASQSLIRTVVSSVSATINFGTYGPTATATHNYVDSQRFVPAGDVDVFLERHYVIAPPTRNYSGSVDLDCTSTCIGGFSCLSPQNFCAPL